VLPPQVAIPLPFAGILFVGIPGMLAARRLQRAQASGDDTVIARERLRYAIVLAAGMVAFIATFAILWLISR